LCNAARPCCSLEEALGSHNVLGLPLLRQLLVAALDVRDLLEFDCEWVAVWLPVVTIVVSVIIRIKRGH